MTTLDTSASRAPYTARRVAAVRHVRAQELPALRGSRILGSIVIERHELGGGSSWPHSVEGAGRIRLSIIRGGRAALGSGDSRVSLQGRQGVFLRAEESPAVVVERADIVSITAPGELLQDERGRGFCGGLLKVTEASVLLGPVFAFVLQLVSAPEAQAGASGMGQYFTERLLQEMVQGLYLDTIRVRRPEEFADTFELACAVIEAQCADPSLTVERIAAELGLSMRQLERLFQGHGVSVARRIRRARVERAARLAADRAYDALRIDDLARYVGFSNGSSLARAMSAEGYPSPARIRRGRLAA